ncbi:uncharacterized protein IUM83_03819 [Phytophthora cinnamomi]|uniref:uncharacterized protein n=1 Tax=Phytophthora cinnamomi TaxID=4785 RepID=UPI00355A1E93|nr:hypothetical protein IUM83_03819 [Phytophthora cinnamomi]
MHLQLAAYHLPNRAFLTNIHDKSIEEISYNILALLGYSSLVILSLIVLGVILQRRTRVSVLRQLAFVLETHWSLVQANVCLWFLLAMQAPLEHYRVDFSFRFKWLNANA